MLFTVTSHPLLSGKVVALAGDSAKFSAQQALAEAVLDLTADYAARLTTDQTARVTMAVVLQMNFQVEQGLDPFVVSQESSVQQGETRTYTGHAVHPQARAIIDAIVIAGDEGGRMVAQFAAIAPVRSGRTPVSSNLRQY